MAKQNTAPTMKDVAKEAGVSLGTVSKVINGIPVGEEYQGKDTHIFQAGKAESDFLVEILEYAQCRSHNNGIAR